MKSLKLDSLLKLTLTFALILGLGLMAGCGDDDDDPTDPGGGGTLPGGTITLSLDGTALNYSDSTSATNMGNADERVVGGTVAGSNDVIMLTFPKEVGTHTVTVNTDASIILANGGVAWFCASGSIVLTTSTDTHLVGSFTGTFEDTQQNTAIVTNGAFDVPLVLVQ